MTPQNDTPTQDHLMPGGATPARDIGALTALALANRKVNFPVPGHVQDALDAEGIDLDALEAAEKAEAAKPAKPKGGRSGKAGGGDDQSGGDPGEGGGQGPGDPAPITDPETH